MGSAMPGTTNGFKPGMIGTYSIIPVPPNLYNVILVPVILLIYWIILYILYEFSISFPIF